MMQPGVPILMYHELESPGRQLCQSEPGYIRYVVPASTFEKQLQRLASLGYKAVNVSRALEFEASPVVALTFDDGCETDLAVAAPLLRRMGFEATFYVTVGFLGRPGYMSETQVRELSNLGFEIGSHSMTHPYLPDLDPAGQRREIIDSKVRLEQITGRRVDHFSCPGGRLNEEVVKIAKAAGYRTLATSRPHLNPRNVDLYHLGRIAILRSSSAEEIGKLCQGLGSWKLSLKQSVRSGASRILGNRLYDRLRSVLLGR